MTPKIHNLTLSATPGTESSFKVSNGVDKLLIKARLVNVALKLAYVSGESGSNYIDIPVNSGGKWIDAAHIRNLTIYLQSPTASAVVEIEEWIQ